MYERSFGYRYAELGDHPTAAEIAKAMRADIKQAVSEGLLPASWSYSVRSDTFAGGQSIEIEVRDCPGAWQDCEGIVPGTNKTLTEDARVAKITLERIHGAYNHDGSEIMVDYFDVRFYGTVTFESASDYDFRMREKERLAAKKSARETGRVVGRVKNYKRDGSSVTHLLIETEGGERVLGCGARIWGGSLISKTADDAPLTCSRCAKRA